MIAQWIESLRAFLGGRSERERWGMVLGASAMALVVVFRVWIQPLREEVSGLEGRAQELRSQHELAGRLAQSVRSLQSELGEIEAKIRGEAETPLLSLLERLATESGLKKFYEAARVEREQHRLGVIGRARVAFALQQRLLAAGYPPAIVKQVLFAMLISAFVGGKEK